MAIIYVTCGCGLVSLISFLVTCCKKRSVTGVFNKALTSILFILTAIFAIFIRNDLEVMQYGLLIAAGLVFGLLGDIFLDQKWVYPDDMGKYLVAGFAVFGIGHVFYCVALFREYDFGVRDLIFPAVFAVVVDVGNYIISKLTKLNFGKFKTILIVYCYIIAFMVGMAIWAALTVKDAASIIFAAAGVLFLLSDIVLSPMYFGEGKNTPVNFFINHITYYLAQYFIALSVVLIK